MKLTNEQTKTLEFLHENDKAIYHQHHLEQMNIEDAYSSLDKGNLIALVDQTQGIIGYIMDDSIDTIEDMLNLQQYSNDNNTQDISLWEHIDNACGSVWNAIENNTNENLQQDLDHAFQLLVSIKQKLEGE